MPLVVASVAGDVARVRELLETIANETIANVNFTEVDGGRTALVRASEHGQADCVRVLLEFGGDAGADSNSASVFGDTVLMLASAEASASTSSNTGVLSLLLEAGANVLEIDESEGTALGYGSAKLDVVQLLCAYVARREALCSWMAPAECCAWVLETSRWSTQLHHLELLPPARVRQLLVGGADVHASDGSGDGAPTPLGLARALLARNPAHEGASLLLRLGQLLVLEARFAGDEVALLDPARLVGFKGAGAPSSTGAGSRRSVCAPFGYHIEVTRWRWAGVLAVALVGAAGVLRMVSRVRARGPAAASPADALAATQAASTALRASRNRLSAFEPSCLRTTRARDCPGFEKCLGVMSGTPWQPPNPLLLPAL
ncbi:hypothetical protein T492DRAFT_915493 [Pavlovales sp. CCMP2436]|nr:hypothetical protein T492DRAFT_915493 [Pavlovales sp. CCMP2436]